MLSYFDICVNIDSPMLLPEADHIIREAQSNGVSYIALTGSSVSSTQTAILIANRHTNCVATCGIHPHAANSYNQNTKDQLEVLSQAPIVRAIGECGLDYNRLYSTKEEQLRCFEGQLQLAQDRGLPVFLHERDAHEDFLAIIREYTGTAVVHCFTGNAAQAQAYLDCGLFIGVTGWVCDERRNHNLLEALPHIPIDRLMIETDSPWLTPRTLRPRPRKNRNTPSTLPHIAAFIAEKIGVSEKVLVNQTTENSRRFFGML